MGSTDPPLNEKNKAGNIRIFITKHIYVTLWGLCDQGVSREQEADC